jgi:hypothetical protein
MMGWQICAEPAAEAFHIFGGFWDAAEDGGLTTGKLRTVIIGRLRFIIRLAGGPLLARSLWGFLLEDGRNVLGMCKRRRFPFAWTYCTGWASVLGQSRSLFAQRRELQRRRALADSDLFPVESTMPKSYTWKNSPLLTAAIVRSEYAPLLRSGATRRVPEVPTVA